MLLLFILCYSTKLNGLQLNSSNEDLILSNFMTLHNLQSDNFQNEQRQLEALSFHSFRLGKENRIANDSNHWGSFLDRGASLSMHLRQMANTELGVTSLQDAFNTLTYVNIKRDEEKELSKMVQSLDEKVKLYTSLLEEMSDIVKTSYVKFKADKLKSNRDISSKNLVLGFGLGKEIEKGSQKHEYYPCCIIPDHYLLYDPHFGTKINTELWCDSGLEPDQLNRKKEIFLTPFKLTEIFTINHHLNSNMKWQFFISASGIHTEYPAHRSGTSVGSDCGQSSRHHHIYEKTVRPGGRNIILLYDLGHTLRPRLLLTAKAIGHYIIDTLGPKDSIAMLGVAESIVLPSPPCLQDQLLSATHDVKKSLRHFIDYLEIQDTPTNHTLGLEKSLGFLQNWSRMRSHSQSVLVIYITRGILADSDEAQHALRVVAEKTDSMNAKVVISAFGLGIPKNEPSFQTEFLETLTKQDYKKFGIEVKKSPREGEVIPISSTLRVPPIIRRFYDVVESPDKTPEYISNVTISEPYWDPQGEGMVVTLSQGVYGEAGEIIGVVGIDLSLSYLLEDATYFLMPDNSYAFVIDKEGNALSHPKMGRPEKWTRPLLSTPVTLVELSTSFSNLAPHILLLPSGHKRSKRNYKREEREYWWKRSEIFGWTFVLAVPSYRPPLRRLSKSMSRLPPHALFHRLDLLSPQEAKVCRHFNQMGTLDGASLFLSCGAYNSPSTYLSKSYRNPKAGSSIMAFLMDESGLLPNPGLKDGVRESVSALYRISSLWLDLQKESKLQKYIIRRYGATFQGVTLMYPGTLMDASFDPKSQEWFIKAVENPGRVVVSSPFLDPGGGGHIVTVSHTVYEGRSATLHSPTDPVQAVLAADFTLGYWHKLLVDIEPLCANSIYFKDYNHSEADLSISIRCFLMDNTGYLIAHPSFVNPASVRHMNTGSPRHITHQEPVLSMALLGKSLVSQSASESVLKKIWCANHWKGSSERHYSFKIKVGEVVESSLITNKLLKSERSCLQYKLTAVPASNLIFGFINQTCSPATAFCPCSMVDRLCLNCQLMENAACECPCECSLPSAPCSPRASSLLPANGYISKERRDSADNSIETNRKTGEGWDSSFSSCPRSAESPGPLHYGVGMLSQLDVCVPMPCDTHTSIHSCLGVLDCVWCVLESDGATPLERPHCTQSHNCYGGIRGGPSPYPPGLSPLPHSKERGSSLPIGPVAGGVIAVFVVMGLAIYFYRGYVGTTSIRNYTSATIPTHNHHSPLYPPESYPELETGENESLDDGIITATAAATMSPYRMNPSYRRPTGNHGEASDHGYSTMTPHDESENLAYTDLATSTLFPSSSITQGWPNSDSEYSHHHSQENYGSGSFETRLSSPKKIGPNRVIVPVTVHMVDTV